MSGIVRELVSTLISHEQASAPRIRARKSKDLEKFHLAIEVIVCNLIVLCRMAPGASLSVPLGNNYLFGNNTPEAYGQTFKAVIRLMEDEELGLITLKRGHRASGGNVSSLLQLGPLFQQWLPLEAIRLEGICRKEAGDVLFLREPKKDGAMGDFISFNETPRTRSLRKQVIQINSFIAKSDIDLLADETGHFVASPLDRTLRRYFNNGHWTEGGRLFGGFWQGMKREDRFRYIRINSEPVVNVDYGQLFPRLAYARAQTEAPEGDLYDIFGNGQSRDGWKKMMNAMLFAQKPLKQWPEDTAELFPKTMKVSEATKLMANHHRPIASLFGTGIGFRLMFIESNILIMLLENLAKENIAALPVHDSVIVAESHAERARDCMQEVMERHTEARDAPVKLERGTTSRDS